MKIVVTGGTGYIGSHTVVELLLQGHEVHILDNLSNSDISMIDRIQEITEIRPYFTQLDLTDAVKVDSFFKNQNDIDGIIHFAALKSVGDSVKLPLNYYQNNILCLVHLLEATTHYAIHNFVFSSLTIFATINRSF